MCCYQAFEDNSYFLSEWIADTIAEPSPESIAEIRKLWDNESWESIAEKFNTEGSVWVVWWQEGVQAYMKLNKDSV